jgi:hypothetical protein
MSAGMFNFDTGLILIENAAQQAGALGQDLAS